MLAPVLLLMALSAGAYPFMKAADQAGAERTVIAPDQAGAAGAERTVIAPSGAIRVVDGDTVWLRGERLRLLVIDAPEISSPRCSAEYQAGMAAKDELSHLLVGRMVHVHYSGRRDVYGRPLVKLSVDGNDVGDHLLSRNLAVRYAWGKTISEMRWCGLW